MKPILSPHDNFPRPTAWTRTAAIETFGVTYLHDTAKGVPIREVLGRCEAPPSATGSVVTAFATDGEAIAHAINLSKAEAQRELDDIETHLAGRGTRLRLALARNWKPAREREVGLLATESIMDRRRRECREIVEKGVRPMVKRLPEGLRMPIVLPLHLPVHVVDMRDFPLREIQLEESRIVSHTFVEVEGHPAYDLVARYHLEGIQGAFSYDHPGLVHKTLEGTPDGLRIFLLHAAAVAHIHDFSQTVQDRLIQGLTPVISIAPRSLPSPQAMARPEPATETPSAVEPDGHAQFEAEVIPFPPSAADTPEFSREWAVASVEQPAEPVDMDFTEIEDLPEEPPAALAAVESLQDSAPEELAWETTPDASCEPEPAPAETATVDRIPVELRALDAVEAALTMPVTPSRVDPEPEDEFASIPSEPASTSSAPATRPAAVSVLSRLTSFLRPKATMSGRPLVSPPRIEPLLQPDASFVKEALDFAASDEAVDLPAVKTASQAARKSEIEGFLRRGSLTVDRPCRQPERESLALGLIAAVTPDLVAEPEEETIAA